MGPRNRVFLQKDVLQPANSAKNPVSLVGVRKWCYISRSNTLELKLCPVN
jgi:sulfur relay (sulfurtransferase) complex TusBCD TusD component (DsrE family)